MLWAISSAVRAPVLHTGGHWFKSSIAHDFIMSTKFELALFPNDRSYSPTFIISRFQRMIEKYGENVVLKNRKFKKARELQIAALAICGLSLIEEKEYWISPEYKDETPDVYAFWIGKSGKIKNSNSKELINIEITVWDINCESELFETILRKLKDKVYPDYYFLLIHAMRPNEVIDLNFLHQKLKNEEPKIGGILLITSIIGNKKDEHMLVNIYPGGQQIVFPLKEVIFRLEHQKEMIKTSFGTGTETILINEMCYLPLPEINN